MYLNGGDADEESGDAREVQSPDGGIVARGASGGSLPALAGGETVFYATSKRTLASVTPQAGAALLHAHGRRCLMHCGAPVMRGTKYVLRCDVMFRK